MAPEAQPCHPHVSVSALREAFLAFTSASERLERSYALLREQTEELRRELGEKNAKLLASLEEKERLQKFLDGILQNLPVGILVTDLRGCVRMANEKARHMLEFGDTAPEGISYRSFPLLRDLPLASGVLRESRNGAGVYRCSVSPLHAATEQGPGWVILLEDVSEVTRWKRLAERQKRLTSMGSMAARIAHEIRNPLGSMELNVTLLMEELRDCGQALELARRLATGVRNLSHVLSNLLQFAKGSDPVREPIDPVRLLSEAAEFAGPLLKEKRIRVRKEVRQAPAFFYGDRVLLRQALLNLIVNAVDAMEPGGSLRLACRHTSEGGEAGTLRPWIRLTVEDNGRGIPEEELDRIFDPFYTTRSEGMGLGLAIVNNIVEAHGGFVEVESRPGMGTAFVLSIPAGQEERHGYEAHSACG
jgi:two-component system sensor histidine kinase FlrB